MPSDSQFWVILVAWLYQNNIHPSEFQQKHKVIWHFIAYLSPTSCFNKTHIFTFSFLSSLVAKIGLMFRFWPIRLQWSPLERSSSYSRKGFFFSFPAVPTHPIFEYGHDAEGNSSPLVSSMRKWVSLPRMVNRKIGRVWSLMTPEAADLIPTQPLPPEFCLCKKSNSYLFKPQWVRFSNIYSQNIRNSSKLVSGMMSQFSFEGGGLASVSQYSLQTVWMHSNQSTGSWEFDS